MCRPECMLCKSYNSTEKKPSNIGESKSFLETFGLQTLEKSQYLWIANDNLMLAEIQNLRPHMPFVEILLIRLNSFY